MDGDLLSSDAVAHLIRNKETLQTLHLDIPGNTTSTAELTASLSGFPVLRNLLLSSRLLYHSAGEPAEDDNILIRLLPPSIISLQLAVARHVEAGVRPRLASGLLHLAQAASRGQFPRLKRVSCDTEQRLDDGLDVLFAAAGVDFGYDGWAFHDGVHRRFRESSPARTITPVDSDDESYYF